MHAAIKFKISKLSFRLILRALISCARAYKKQLKAALILFSVILLEFTLYGRLRIFGIAPDLSLAALVIYPLFFSLSHCLGFAFLAGILRDAISALPFGFNTIACLLWVILAKRISQKLAVEHILIRSAMLGVIILLNNLFMRLSANLFFTLYRQIDFLPAAVFLINAFFQSALTIIFSLPIYRILRRLFLNRIGTASNAGLK